MPGEEKCLASANTGLIYNYLMINGLCNKAKQQLAVRKCTHLTTTSFGLWNRENV
jgi:hypothetical protein